MTPREPLYAFSRGPHQNGAARFRGRGGQAFAIGTEVIRAVTVAPSGLLTTATQPIALFAIDDKLTGLQLGSSAA
jgi:hypothetical protein